MRPGRAPRQHRPMRHPETATAFYATPRGQVAAGVLRQRIARLWPALPGLTVLGLGYALPYLSLWRDHAYACLAAVPPCHPPAPGTCRIDDGHLPLPDLSVDRILLVHGIDLAPDVPRLLRELWRVLKDDGRVIVVAPNRMGMWAHAEATPFGHGRPYSGRQIARTLREASFSPEHRESALFIPPSEWRVVLRWHGVWEPVWRTVAPDFGGVFLVEAVKDAYAAVPVMGVARRRVILPEAA